MATRSRATRVVLVLVAETILVVGFVQAAPAHEGKLPKDALTLVRQASALLAQNPRMKGEARERLVAALKSKKPEGVNLDQARQALRALDQGDIATARARLMASIRPAGMPKPPSGPRGAAAPPTRAPIAAPAAPRAVKPEKPPSVEEAMQMAEPLRVRFSGSRVEVLLLVAAAALTAVGLISLVGARRAPQP